METLNANATITLGPFPKGAILTILTPKSDNIYDFPDLNGIALTVTFAPVSVTLAANSNYALTAGRSAITYEIKQ